MSRHLKLLCGSYWVLEKKNLVCAKYLEKYTREDGNALIKGQMGSSFEEAHSQRDAISAMCLQPIALEWFFAL